METIIKAFDELTLRELYEILKLRCDVFVVEQACPYPDIDGKDEASHHLMVKDGGELAAYLRVLPVGLAFCDAVSLGRVIVRPDRRGGGVARSLMISGIEHARAAFGAGPIKIMAQHHLENFYASLGFRTITDVYLEDDIPHVDMVRD